jgi:CubicO group peptidase (beta-lactamase class C family)
LKFSFFTCSWVLLTLILTPIVSANTNDTALELSATKNPRPTSIDAPPKNASTIYPHEDEPIGTVHQIYDGALFPDIQVNTFRNTHKLFPTRVVRAGSKVLPLPLAKHQLDNLTFKYQGKHWDLFDYLSLNRVGGIIVITNGEIAFERYLLGNNPSTKWMSMSVVKSMVATLVGVAIHDGFIDDIDDLVTRYLPDLVGSAYDGVSIRQLLQMSSGVAWNEAYADKLSDRRAMLNAQISQEPDSILRLMANLKRAAKPGTRWNYSTGETQVVSALITAATGKTLAEYFSKKIWQPFGMESDASWWLDSPKGLEIGGSGLSATLRDYARFGLYMLAEGKIAGLNTLPLDWVARATQAQNIDGKVVNYGYMWWPTYDDAYLAIGIFGQYIYVHPKSKTVIAVWSAQPKPEGTNVIDEFVFFDAVVDALH